MIHNSDRKYACILFTFNQKSFLNTLLKGANRKYEIRFLSRRDQQLLKMENTIFFGIVDYDCADEFKILFLLWTGAGPSISGGGPSM